MMTRTSACKITYRFAAGGSQQSSQRGFTLLEILLVLAILAMASIFVVPNMGGLETRSFNAQLRQAHSLLNYARRTAVVSGQSSSVRLNLIPSDEIDQEDRPPSRGNVVAEWQGGGIELRVIDSTDREIEVDESTEVTFYPEGGSSGGVLLFAQAEQRGVIEIDPFTGRVSSRDPEEEL